MRYLVLYSSYEGDDATVPAAPYVALVYQNASNECEISSLELLDINYYVTPDDSANEE